MPESWCKKGGRKVLVGILGFIDSLPFVAGRGQRRPSKTWF